MYGATERMPLVRINVYSQEITGECIIVSKQAEDTGLTYYGVRMYLASPDVLHHTPDDDDRSAITFWIPSAERFDKNDLANLLSEMSQLVEQCPQPQAN